MKKLEKLKTFEDACKVLRLNSKKVLPDFSCYPKQDHAAMQAHAKLVIIVRAANLLTNKGKEWKPDWSNYGQWKYYPWFEMGSSSGVGFSYYDCAFWYTFSFVGSRLCFKSADLAKHAGQLFEQEIYKPLFTI